MTNNLARSSDASQDPIEDVRMSFGDHLEELRRCVILALAGIFVGSIVGLLCGKQILGIICYPLFRAQISNGLPPQAQVLSPTGAFTAYLKLSLLAGLILAMPWVLYQIWSFVVSGLYAHERRFMRYLVPASSGLFVVGVLFLYFVVLPIVLNFVIRFNMSFGIPEFEAAVTQNAAAQSTEAQPLSPTFIHPGDLPVLTKDPDAPQPGDAWVNETSRRLMVQTHHELLSLPLEVGANMSAMQSQFAIDYYVSFVLVLALASGITFETPVVVFFLSWSGLVPTRKMQKGRRYVLLATVVVAAVITPPDVVSQLLLAVPMYLLFELGILAARLLERKQVSVD